MIRINRLLLALALLMSPPSHAHLLKVFAFAEGNRIEGSVYFVGGAPAPGATVEVRTSGHRLLAELTPDAEGVFEYSAKDTVDHLIKADTGDGHVARWMVPADEIIGELASPGGAGKIAETAGTDATSSEPAAKTRAASPSNSGNTSAQPSDELNALFEQAVARQIRPLREQIIAYQEQVRLRDVIGGLGYIIGLAGIAAWWQKRREAITK